MDENNIKKMNIEIDLTTAENKNTDFNNIENLYDLSYLNVINLINYYKNIIYIIFTIG